jgi:hypothetical protein
MDLAADPLFSKHSSKIRYPKPLRVWGKSKLTLDHYSETTALRILKYCLYFPLGYSCQAEETKQDASIGADD